MDLNPKVHRVYHKKVRALQAEFRWVIEFALTLAGLANGLENVAFQIENEDLVPKRVGDVDSLRLGVNRDAGGTFEKAFSAFQTANRPEGVFHARRKRKSSLSRNR